MIKSPTITFFPLFLLVFIPGAFVATTAEAQQQYTQETIQQEITQELTREREQTASEDPLDQRQSEKTDNPVLHEIMPNRYNFYGSLRLRYRETNTKSVLGDGGTRVGSDGAWQFVPDYWLLGRVEAGFKLFDHLDQLLDPGSQGDGTVTEDIFLRLAYVGVEFPRAFLTYGKNWSTYYQVASFTDRFQGTGGDASGTFNAGTDGGASGTGRADQVWQTRLQIEHPWKIVTHLNPFNINLQYQAGEKIPYAQGARYNYSLGVSAILERTDNFKTGCALNYATINKNDLPHLKTIGIDGNDLALLYGFQWFGEKWYAATVFSYLENHMATADGIYFDAWGTEGYGHYQLFDRIWLTGGWNYLTPMGGEEQAGNYTLQYAVVGLRYTFKDFQRMIYANIRFDKSRLSSTSSENIGNTYTVGVRWDFDW
jgi:predicted porin